MKNGQNIVKPFIFLKKKLAVGTMLLFPAIAQAVLPIASPNEPCMWPWTQPYLPTGSTWEAVNCTSAKNPYKRSCKKEIFHILSERDGYVKYTITYLNSEGEKIVLDYSGKAKFVSCGYDSFKRIDK